MININFLDQKSNCSYIGIPLIYIFCVSKNQVND
jgi:hypothetical protein